MLLYKFKFLLLKDSLHVPNTLSEQSKPHTSGYGVQAWKETYYIFDGYPVNKSSSFLFRSINDKLVDAISKTRN